ncbi:MAG: acyl--CoA ligase [Clostridiales bacterium]|nr:acyl--CoA ligase [Clostridiales bacterium]
MPITELLERNSKNYPDDIALVEINPELMDKAGGNWRESALIEPAPEAPHRKEMSWRAFDEEANRLANLLLARGIKKGDKVAILLMNCLEWLPIYFGVLKTGALAVPFNYRYTTEEIDYCLQLAEADGILFGPEFIDRLEPLLGRHGLSSQKGTKEMKFTFFVGENTPDFAESYDALIGKSSAAAPMVSLCDDDLAAIYFSSGTTGFPKAILHAHRALMHACKTEQAHHGQTKEDVFLCIPPLYHTGAKMHWFGSLLVGGRSVLLKGVKPEWIMETVSKEQCTIVWLLVPWAQDLLDAIESGRIALADYAIDTWRLMHIGAQPVPPSLIKRWKKVFPTHQYDTNYGLSESIGPGCVHLGVENIHKVGAIGKAGYGWQTQIVDAGRNPVARGQVGELAVKGPGVMLGYYKDEKATKESLADGWLYTGDMAEEDEDGFIYLVDRKKDVIITGGENLYPVQIEDFLRKNEHISDAAVIGLPDARLGEIAAAIVQVKEGHTLSEEQFNAFCADLPRYKRPRRVIFAHVPRNATGKIEKPKLRELYGAKDVVAQQNEITEVL